MKISKSIKYKFIVIFALVILAVGVLLAYTSFYFSRNAVINEVESALIAISREGANLFRSQLDIELTFMDTIAARRIVVDETPLAEKLAFLQTEADRMGYEVLAIVDLNGDAIRSDGATPNVFDRGYYQKAVQGESNVSDVLISRTSGEPVVIFAAPVIRENKVVNVLYGVRDAKELSDLVANIAFGQTGYAYVVNDQSTVIAHPNLDLVLEQYNVFEDAENNRDVQALADIMKNHMLKGEQGIGYYYFNGKDRIMGYVPIAGTSWYLAVATLEQEVFSEVFALRNLMIILALLSIAAGVIVAYYAVRPIIRNVKDLTVFITAYLSRGDFAAPVPSHIIQLQDEYGELARGLDTMQSSLRQTFSTFGTSQQKVSASSESLAASSQQMNASLEEVAASANEFSGNAQALSNSAGQMGELGNRTSQQAREGNAAVENAVNEMQEISDIVNSLKAVVSTLGDRAQDISKIVITIKSIADQTNLLALNAAIEAARAGEQGRGFSVVADEVRKLAEQSAGSASEITEMVGVIDKQIQEVMQRMDTGVTRVEKGTEVVLGAGEVLKSITASLDDIAHQIEQVSSAAQEIGAGSEEVSAAVEEQTATMNEISGAAMELQGLVNELESALGRFQY